MLRVATPFPADAELLPDVTAFTVNAGEKTIKVTIGITRLKAMRACCWFILSCLSNGIHV